ncbi:MAG TPA: rubredoxin [Sedimenticola sp.]|nr:rubredoxin [Sedimenticola sp.]
MGKPPEVNSTLQQRIGDADRLECRICWTVYDPATGDPAAGIPPGTPFSRLPDDWRCPECAAGREMFLVMDSATDA